MISTGDRVPRGRWLAMLCAVEPAAVDALAAGMMPAGVLAPAGRFRPAALVSAAMLIAVAIFVPATAAAQTAPAGAPLTLGEAVASALARHPTLASARAASDRAASAVREARGARLPVVTAEASATRFTEPMVVAPLHGFDARQPPVFDRTLMQGSLNLGYTLYDGGARGARIDRASALSDAAELGLEGARQALVVEVVRAYLRVRAAREILNAHDHRVEALTLERDRAAQLFDRGRAARVLVLRAEAAQSAARADGVAAGAELEVAQRALARVMGVDPARTAGAPLEAPRLTRPDEALDRDALIERALAGSPEVARLRSRFAAAEELGAEARALWLPKLQLAGRYVEYASGLGRHQGEWQAGLQLSYPVLTGGTRRAAVDRAAAESGAARAELEVARLRVADAVDRAVSAVASARARAAALAAAVAQSEEVVRIEKLSLDAGSGVQTDYLAAVAELFRARAAWTEARHAEIAARVELARATGELDANWLARNLESER